MSIEVKGLKEIQNKFNKFKFRGKNIKYRFLEMIGVESLELLKLNTPIDTGALREAWVLQQSENEISIINDQHHLLSYITFGTIRHIPNPFISKINHQVDNMVMARLELALAESHEFFAKLPGGKNRRMQQVGRTSAGFKGGVSFAGRSTLVRAGTGRRQLKRRLSLRRRRGKSVNPARKDVKVG
jgi:hypothetical protein